MNVRAWIQKRDSENYLATPLLNTLDSGIVQPVHRQELVRIAVAGMLKLTNHNMYPSARLKLQLAQDIITAFPKLRSKQGVSGYEHFYNIKKNAGFIEFRLKTLRRANDPKTKKRYAEMKNKSRVRRREAQLNLANEENFPDVSESTSKTPDNSNVVEEERDAMETQTDKISKFKDITVDMVTKIFSEKYSGTDCFMEKFPSFYAPRILKYCQKAKPRLLQMVNDIDDENFKALVLLPEILPCPNYAKRKDRIEKYESESKNLQKPKPSYSDVWQKKIPCPSLLRFFHGTKEQFLVAATSMSEFNDDSKPFLICCKEKYKKGDYYIKIDGTLISIGENAMVAFDILLKIHLCFNIQFALDLVNFYDFITGGIFKLHAPKGCSIAMITTLQNVDLFESDPLNTSCFEEGNLRGNDEDQEPTGF